MQKAKENQPYRFQSEESSDVANIARQQVKYFCNIAISLTSECVSLWLLSPSYIISEGALAIGP